MQNLRRIISISSLFLVTLHIIYGTTAIADSDVKSTTLQATLLSQPPSSLQSTADWLELGQQLQFGSSASDFKTLQYTEEDEFSAKEQKKKPPEITARCDAYYGEFKNLSAEFEFYKLPPSGQCLLQSVTFQMSDEASSPKDTELISRFGPAEKFEYTSNPCAWFNAKIWATGKGYWIGSGTSGDSGGTSHQIIFLTDALKHAIDKKRIHPPPLPDSCK